MSMPTPLRRGRRRRRPLLEKQNLTGMLGSWQPRLSMRCLQEFVADPSSSIDLQIRAGTDGAAGGRGEAGVGIDMQLDTFRFSGHECPRG